MNQMLVNQQEWLKEKESLYNRLAIAEQEKQDLIELFKSKIGTVLEASAKNIQTAEAAKANFQRIVKGLKARNEQLRKRIEADAQIIKNAKNNLYLKSQSIEELKDKSAALAAASSKIDSVDSKSADGELNDAAREDDDTASSQQKLSAEYAILGITGRAGVMTVELIDSDGQPLTLKIGSPLPTGHVVSEIGSDYAKFSRDGHDDYLYVGR
jgi:chromosome segregation ATPase